MKLLTYPDRDMMFLDVADQLASELSGFLRNQDRVTFCVPGGSTPGPVFDVLCDLDLDWARVSVVLSDERWVDEGSVRSNTRLVRQRLLRGRASAATLVPLYAAGLRPEDRLAELTAGLLPHLPLSLLLLGMGDDMHIASLFPGADQLVGALAADAPPLMAMRAPGAPEPRVTLTAPVLAGAMSTHLLLTGADKRAALDRAQHLDPSHAPVRCVLGHACVHWAA